MTPPPSAVRPLAMLATALVLAAAGCGTATDQGGATAAPPVTVTATQAPTPTASSPAAPPATSSPRATSGTGGPGDETCTASALRVTYADDEGGAGAGSVNGTFTFTNESSRPCTLRGFPGVSFVGGRDRTQVGEAATRTDGPVTTTTLKGGGGRAEAALRRSQPRNYGGSCDEAEVGGFRVYPPGSTDALFVAFPTTGCRSSSAPLLQVGPVRERPVR